jgi:septal ring factor EnvC (AmiA/AmiB activator)
MTAPDPGVYISPAQMYQEVRSLAEAVGRIETKIDGILNETKDIRTDLADHETRIRTLERARWPLPTLGVLAGVAGAATGAVSLFAR